MSSFFFLPAPPVVQEVVPEKGAFLKRGASQEAGDFNAFLEACCGNIGLFAVPPVSPSTRACSFPAANEETFSLPCPLSSGSTVSLSPLALIYQGEGVTADPLERFSAFLSDALEMVESFAVTLRLDKGNVTVSGLRGNDGNFSFSIEGKKEALIEFFTLLFENLRVWFEGHAKEGTQCTLSQCGCRRVSCGDVGDTRVTGTGGSELLHPSGETVPEASGIPETTLSELSPPAGSTLPSEAQVTQTEIEGDVARDSMLPAEEKGKISLLPEGEDTPLLRKEDGKRVAFAPEKNRTQDNTPSFDEDVAQFLVSVRDIGESSSQETTTVTTPVTAEDFARVFEEVLRGVSEVRGRKEVVLHLEPEHLGSIVVRLEDQGGKIHCIWEVANPETRALLVKYLPVLEAHLSAQGMFFENFLGDGSNAYAFWSTPWPQVSRGTQDEEIPLGDFEVSQVNFLV